MLPLEKTARPLTTRGFAVCSLPDPNPIPCWEWQTALELATTLNQQYVVARQTSVQMWCPIYS